MTSLGSPSVDIAVIGGGIAGASAAAHLAPHATVLLLEQERELAYHTTSRSAAVFFESDDDGIFDQLVAASRTFFDSDHPELDGPLLRSLPLLMVGDDSHRDQFEAAVTRARARAAHIRAEVLIGDELRERCPVLTDAATVGRIETTAAEIDVMALHQLFVRRSVEAGGKVGRSAKVTSIEASTEAEGSGRRWRLSTAAGPVEADIIVNAAGAWGDEIAAMAGAAPVGLTPMRRTAFTTRIEHDPSNWPFVYSSLADLPCYFKPEAGNQLLCSLADETPMAPGDARPEEIDVAQAIDHLNQLTTLNIRSVATTWAGQRTFTPDRIPVWGYDDAVDGFFWFNGQGGWGIGTSPAAGQIAEGLIIHGAIPGEVTAFGINAEALSPSRFR